MADSTVPAEIIFAQHLAANEKVHRDRAIRRLHKYFYNHSSQPSGGFTETELLKIWKGLHYCMWMQDKPLIQEELSTNIANLVHSFNNSKTSILFLKTFYITECREWLSIDKWRMDKFLMMFRNMLTKSFELLKQKNWSDKFVREILDFLSNYIILDHDHTRCPVGVRFHLADTYLAELQNVSQGQLGPKQTVTFLQPWIEMLSGIKCKTLRAYVIKNIFGELLQQSPAVTGKPRKKNCKLLRVNYQRIADKLLEVGSSEACASYNRPAIYNLVQNFRDVAQGKLPFAPEDQVDEEVEDLDDDDIEGAVERLAQFQENLQKENREGKRQRKRKQKEMAEVDEAYGSESSADSESPIEEKKSRLVAKSSYSEKSQPKILSKRLKKMLEMEKEFLLGCDDDQDEGDETEGADTSLSVAENVGSTGIKEPEGNGMTSKRHKKRKERATVQTAGVSESEDLTHAKGESIKKKSKRQQIADDTTTTDTSKPADLSADFEVEDFPNTEEGLDISLVAPPTPMSVPQSAKQKSRKNKKGKQVNSTEHHAKSNVAEEQALKGSSRLARFEENQPVKAKYFKKAMSKSVQSPSVKSEEYASPERIEKKRISFGKSRSVEKTKVKLKGSLSYDPTKTPEQGILKVNPILPGTVIQVGRQATLRNTLKNSKFPQRMMAADFF